MSALHSSLLGADGVGGTMRGKLFLFHWNPPEADLLARDLRAANWRVDVECEDTLRARRRIKERPPDAVVISLARSPVYGLEIASALRASKMNLTIVFLDGKDETIQTAKTRVPAAIFATSGELADILDAHSKAGWG
jgi:DNA-binding NarL/FixJ family response regulator